MSLDGPSEAAVAGDEGAGAGRPGCVTVYAALLLLGGAVGLLLPFARALDPQASISSTQELSVLSIRSMAHAAVSIATAVGLWRLQRWGMGLVVAHAAYGLAIGLCGAHLAAAYSAGSTVLYALIPLSIFLIVVYWFVKNRVLFKPSPSLDRWIVGAGALVLVAIFFTEILWG